ncbi:hypothetical protein BMG00_13820 [Thioclava marina]|jgi:hypothetical protein|uniref:Uncharacterized protein n=2 Tax=Paracoccaceae TaxID=31989 RepID=A0ABX3ML70_9RHOB|nr:hypothetical protein [Thioclava marina]OOY12122.1 hypothetical protein BMG00_13820 [Thioclava marina]TNE91484.1 MAG: hypothetical protein EP337_06320 [Paracoccaceae bacterium]
MMSHLDLPAVPAMTEQARPVRVVSPEALIAGPCALPAAPMAMPPQQIEPDLSLSTRLARLFTRRPVGEGT